jgi:hypothetical protein
MNVRFALDRHATTSLAMTKEKGKCFVMNVSSTKHVIADDVIS